MTTKDTLILADNGQLTRHPRNMRRSYPKAAVRKMGLSQAERARSGQTACVQPLVVTVGAGVQYDPAAHREFVIVAGHLRHAGNAWLGDKAPPLNCIVRYYASEADMLADMGAENGVREDPGPSGWAIFLRGQLDAGVPMHQLLRRTGLTLNRAQMLLEAADMPPAVLSLLDAGKLPLTAVAHLKRITDAARQAKMARKFAKSGATLAQIELAVRASLKQEIAQRQANAKRKTGRPQSANEAPALRGVPANEKMPATLAHVRIAAARACANCEASGDQSFDEPAWRIAVDATTAVCKACDLRVFEAVCKACPLAEAMCNIVQAVKARRQPQAMPAAHTAHAAQRREEVVS